MEYKQYIVIQSMHKHKHMHTLVQSISHARNDIDHSHVKRSRDNEHFSRLSAWNSSNHLEHLIRCWKFVSFSIYVDASERASAHTHAYSATDCVKHWLDACDFITNFILYTEKKFIVIDLVGFMALHFVSHLVHLVFSMKLHFHLIQTQWILWNGICFYKKTHIDLLSIVLHFRLYQVGFCLT